jgi:hypothetical protein
MLLLKNLIGIYKIIFYKRAHLYIKAYLQNQSMNLVDFLFNYQSCNNNSALIR